MENYIEIILLAVLVILVYKKPEFLQNINENKIILACLILLNAYILKTVSMSAGIIMALINIVLLDTKENFCDSKEGFVSKIQVWRPANFRPPCQVDLDRNMKILGEKNTIASTQ